MPSSHRSGMPKNSFQLTMLRAFLLHPLPGCLFLKEIQGYTLPEVARCLESAKTMCRNTCGEPSAKCKPAEPTSAAGSFFRFPRGPCTWGGQGTTAASGPTRGSAFLGTAAGMVPRSCLPSATSSYSGPPLINSFPQPLIPAKPLVFGMLETFAS